MKLWDYLNAIYEKRQTKFKLENGSEIDLFKSLIKEGASVLFVGVPLTNELCKLNENYNVVGLQNYNRVEDIRNKLCPEVTIYNCQLDLENDEFDAVYSNKGFVWNDESELSAQIEWQYNLLRNGGTLIHIHELKSLNCCEKNTVMCRKSEIHSAYYRFFYEFRECKYIDIEGCESIAIIAVKNQ